MHSIQVHDVFSDVSREEKKKKKREGEVTGTVSDGDDETREMHYVSFV